MKTDLRLRTFAAILVVAGALGVALSYHLSPLTPSYLLLALAFFAMLGDILTVQISSVSVSMTYPVLGATIILLGPTAAGIVAAASPLPSAFSVKEKPIVRGLFNIGQLCFTTVVAGWVYLALGGRLLAGSPLVASEIPRVILPLVGMALVTFALNTVLVAAGVTMMIGVPFLRVWRSSFAWTIPTQASLTLLALALSQVVASEGVVGLALFAVPLLISRQFYERYIGLRKAYSDTVRSLVAVIEAKDAYTRGHSERVARYAVEVSRRLGFSDQRVERMELAALLHDLGKVAVRKDVLAKPGRLNEEELAEIRSHPDIGARIIESVPFLSDLVPLISAHHERMDGSGYGAQLVGDEIPLEARVLSVADAFDAMTSSRPYRSPMTVDATVCELRRCAGQQFDPLIVETFIEAVSEGGIVGDFSGDLAEGANEAV